MSFERDVTPQFPALRAIAAGGVVAIAQAGQAVALAALVFASGLAEGLHALTLLFLVAAILPAVLISASRSIPAPVFVAVQNAPIAILLPALAVAAGSQAPLPTVVAVLGATALVTGLLMGSIATFDLGRLIRLLPYPVSAGFLASTGALLILSSIAAIANLGDIGLGSALSGGGQPLLPVAFALGFGLVLWVSSKAAPNLGVIIALAAGLVATHVALSAFGVPDDVAQSLALKTPAQPAQQTALLSLVNLASVDWDAFQDAVPLMCVAALVATIGCLLNIAGIETSLSEDIDPASVLKRTAIGNLANGIAGAPLAYPSASSTSIGFALGGPGIVAVLTVAALLGVAALSVDQIISFLPPFIMAGTLIYIGLELLDRWFFAQRKSLSMPDWALTGTFVVVAVAFGMVAAIQLGLIVACLAFAISYGRLRVVRSAADLRSRRSRVDRGPYQTEYLDAHGEEVAVVVLQGYLFFGSIEQLAAHIRTLVDREVPVQRVILDFARVRQIDAAAVAAMQKLQRMADRRSITLVLTEMPTAVEEAITRAGLFSAGSAFLYTRRLDDALEDAEAHLLARIDHASRAENALSTLERLIGSSDVAERLLASMEKMPVSAGEFLIRKGETSTDIYFVDTGRLAIQIPGADGAPLRVRSITAGALVGEMASYMDQVRGADVIAETDGVVYRLDVKAMETLASMDPELVVAFHRTMASALAEKLHRTNELLSEVL